MSLACLEIAHSKKHAVLFPHVKLSSHFSRVSVRHGNAVGNNRQPRFVQAEVMCELPPGRVGHHNGVIRAANRPSQSNSAPQRFADSLRAVHGNNVRQSEDPRSRGAVDRHREFVAVDCVDSVFPEETHQTAYAARVNRPPEPEYLGGEAGPTKMFSEPASSSGWADG